MLQLLSRFYIVFTSLRRPQDRVIFVVGTVAAVVITGVVVGQMKMQREAENAPPPRIEMGEIVAGSPREDILPVSEEHVWRITGQKGERIAIALDADWDSLLLLYLPDGIQTLTRDGFSAGNGRAWIDGVTLPRDGMYGIVVIGENGEAGPYRLRVDRLN